MSRIVTNVQSVISQNVLRLNNKSLDTSLERLSTGYRINRGKDDPAGLIASENLRAEKSGLTAAIGNGERADQVMNIAEGGLQETSRLLEELQGLVVSTANDAGLSQEEKEANQLQVDSILDAIDRISQTTNFQGVQLLNGTFDYQVSGINTAQITNFDVAGAKGFEEGNNIEVNTTILQSAQQAGLFLSMGGSSIALGNDAEDRFTFEVAGVNGSREFTFASGSSVSDIADAINEFSEVLGVEATNSGTGLVLKSENYGDSEYVSVRVVDDGNIASAGGIFDLGATNTNSAGAARITFSSATGANAEFDDGQDVEVSINGQIAVGDGLDVSITSDVLTTEFTLTASQATGGGTSIGTAFTAFTIYGGGASFMLGADVNLTNESSIGIKNTASRFLGRVNFGEFNSVDGYNNLNDLKAGKDLNLLDGDLGNAQQVVDKAIREIATIRGRIGAFQANTVQPAIRNLSTAFENTSAAESQIRDTDFSKETANLTRNQILVNAATASLSIANTRPQNVLSLLQ